VVQIDVSKAPTHPVCLSFDPGCHAGMTYLKLVTVNLLAIA